MDYILRLSFEDKPECLECRLRLWGGSSYRCSALKNHPDCPDVNCKVKCHVDCPLKPALVEPARGLTLTCSICGIQKNVYHGYDESIEAVLALVIDGWKAEHNGRGVYCPECVKKRKANPPEEPNHAHL